LSFWASPFIEFSLKRAMATQDKYAAKPLASPKMGAGFYTNPC